MEPIGHPIGHPYLLLLDSSLGTFRVYMHGCNESHILTPIKVSLDPPMWEKSHGRTKKYPKVATIDKLKLFMINEPWDIFVPVGLWPTNRFILLTEFSMLFPLIIYRPTPSDVMKNVVPTEKCCP